MRIDPVITEKTIALAKAGKYTFLVDPGLNKYQIKELVERTFSVHVISVSTIMKKGEHKRTMAGKKRFVKPVKKAVVSLKDKEKIDIFEVKES